MTGTRLILLGFRDAGTSSSGNTILGGKHFHGSKTVQCVKKEGHVDGRHIIIIKAPGWGKDQLLRDTPELMKEEMTLSVSQCHPGPDSVLLVMRAGMKFTESSRRAAQEHMELLGANVWTHTIVLFTHGDWLGERSIKQYIDSEGKPLQWLVDKCSNRYHVFCNADGANKDQVSKLLSKVDETVAQNSHCHYKLDEGILKAVEERKKSEKSKAEEMKNKLLEQSDVKLKKGDGEFKKSQQTMSPKSTTCDDALKTQTGKSKPPQSPFTIVILGHSNARKFSVGNSFLGKDEFLSENTLQSVRKQGQMDGRQITVINTPGWGPEQRLTDTPELTKQEIILSVSSCGQRPHVLVLVIRVEETFTELNRRAVQDHMDLLGPKVWEHTFLLVDGLDYESVETHINREDKSLKWLVEKCGNSYGVIEVTNPLKESLEAVSSLAESGGSHYGMEKLVQEVEKKRQGEKERGNRRKEKQQDLSKRLEEMKIKEDKPGTSLPLSKLQIILLGHRGAGKTAAGNTILGKKAFKGKKSVQSVKEEAQVSGRHTTVIGASDWGKEQLLMDTPELTKQEIMLSLSMCSPGPHALLVVVNLALRFTEGSRRAVQEHLELFSEKVWNHCMVLFTCEEWLGDITIEQYIESEGKPLQWLIERCGDRYHVLSLKSGKENSQVTQLMQKIECMVAGNGGSHFEPDMGH